jgi:hypothetical protein
MSPRAKDISWAIRGPCSSWRPSTSIRRSPIEARQPRGRRPARTTSATARENARKLIASHYPEYIGHAADEKIRARFPIVPPRKAMRPGNERW